MTIEIARGAIATIYRISPTDKRNIEQRANTHGARWTFYARRDTEREAKATLLRLERGTWQEEEGDR